MGKTMEKSGFWRGCPGCTVEKAVESVEEIRLIGLFIKVMLSKERKDDIFSRIY